MLVHTRADPGPCSIRCVINRAVSALAHGKHHELSAPNAKSFFFSFFPTNARREGFPVQHLLHRCAPHLPHHREAELPHPGAPHRPTGPGAEPATGTGVTSAVTSTKSKSRAADNLAAADASAYQRTQTHRQHHHRRCHRGGAQASGPIQLVSKLNLAVGSSSCCRWSSYLKQVEAEGRIG